MRSLDWSLCPAPLSKLPPTEVPSAAHAERCPLSPWVPSCPPAPQPPPQDVPQDQSPQPDMGTGAGAMDGVGQGNRDPPAAFPSQSRGEPGPGLLPQIYKGTRQDQDEEDRPHQPPVGLEVMDSSHHKGLEGRGFHSPPPLSCPLSLSTDSQASISHISHISMSYSPHTPISHGSHASTPHTSQCIHLPQLPRIAGGAPGWPQPSPACGAVSL